MKYIQLIPKKKIYIILKFNYLMINIFLVIFLNKKVWSILNPIRKVSLFILSTTFWTKKKKNTYWTKEVKGIKINLKFIFNNFPVHRTGLRLVDKIIRNFFFSWVLDFLWIWWVIDTIQKFVMFWCHWGGLVVCIILTNRTFHNSYDGFILVNQILFLASLVL